jgi:hypothetical protein
MTRRQTLLLLAQSAASPKFEASFPGGSLGPVKAIGASHYRVGVKGQYDENSRNRQASWYYFRVSGPDQELTIDLADLPGEYNFQPTRGAITADTRPYWRPSGQTQWSEAPGEFDPAEPHWRLKLKGSFELAHLPPYTLSNLDTLRAKLKPQVEVIGRSPAGRPLELWTFDLSSGPKAPVVWLMFRQHAWEAGTNWTGEGMLASLPKGIVWKVFPCCDPDGVEQGAVRFNKHGFDFNRNWDRPDDPVLRPEITAQKAALARWFASGRKIDLFLTLHNTETSEYLEGPEEGIGPRLSERLKANTAFDPSRPYSTNKAPLRANRVNAIEWLWGLYKAPALLMELRIAKGPKSGLRPTPDSWQRLGREMTNQIAALLAENR